MLSDPDQSIVMTPRERAKAVVLVVETDNLERHNMRTTIKALGYGGISDAPNHAAALERMDQRKFTHIIFGAKPTNMPAREFLKKVLEVDNTIVAIPTSFEPNVDDVFELLIMGARGYLVRPWTTDSLEQAITMATKGEPMAEVVLQAKDRNEALVAIMMSSLDKAATILRQAEKFETAEREIPKAMGHLSRSVELAKTFAKGGDEGLITALERMCIERGQGPATRLGRLRKKLRSTRSADDNGNETGEEGEAANQPEQQARA